MRKLWVRIAHSWEEHQQHDREWWAQFSGNQKVEFADGPTPHEEHIPFLTALREHGVRALVIGAYAFCFHVKSRYTENLDLFIEPNAENMQRLESAKMAAPCTAALYFSIDGVTFEEAWANRVAGMFAEQPVFYIGEDAFIRNKEAAGRNIDQRDIAVLRMMR